MKRKRYLLELRKRKKIEGRKKCVIEDLVRKGNGAKIW